jgi:hypothetical protein
VGVFCAPAGITAEQVARSLPKQALGISDDTQATVMVANAMNKHWGSIKAKLNEYEKAVEQFNAAGGVCVIAAGNSGQAQQQAGLDAGKNLLALDNGKTVNVGATDDNGQIAQYSSASNSMAMVANGKAPVATQNSQTGQFEQQEGTSFAAPKVAGKIARLMQTERINGQEAVKRLKASATPIDGATKQQQGAGRIETNDSALQT